MDNELELHKSYDPSATKECQEIWLKSLKRAEIPCMAKWAEYSQRIQKWKEMQRKDKKLCTSKPSVQKQTLKQRTMKQ